MGGFIQPEIETEDRQSKLRVLVIGAVLVAIIVGVLAYISVQAVRPSRHRIPTPRTLRSRIRR